MKIRGVKMDDKIGTKKRRRKVDGNEEIKEVDEIYGALYEGMSSEEMCPDPHYAQYMAGRRGEIVVISSDDDDEDAIIVVSEVKGKGKQVNQMNTNESLENFSHELGGMEMEWAEPENIHAYENLNLGSRGMEMDCELSDDDSWDGVGRYTVEEKGKAKVGDSWPSLSSKLAQMDVISDGEEFGTSVPFQYETKGRRKFYNPELKLSYKFRLDQAAIDEDMAFFKQIIDQVPANNQEFGREWTADDDIRTVDVLRHRADTVSHRAVSKETARQLARFNHKQVDTGVCSSGLNKKSSSIELGNSPCPFSTALNMIRERNLKKNVRPLIGQNAYQIAGLNRSAPRVPSLLNLSLNTLARNVEALVSLEGIPDTLRKRLTDFLCDSRRMDTHMLNLLLKGSPNEIRIKDCSWLTENEFSKSFQEFDGRKLMVLQLDLCGQCLLDHVLAKTLARSPIGWPNLGILSLRGACRLTDMTFIPVVASAPFLQSINIGQCSLLTHRCIEIISNSLGGLLKELYINECPHIDAICTIPALKKLRCLEVLSVAGIETVCDRFVCEVVKECGQNLKELDFADCYKLTDYSMKVIGDACANLRSLNISNLYQLTDRGMQFLANGCRSIQRLNLQHTGFSDEALAAYIEASGQCLKQFSLNNCSQVDLNTAFSLAKCSRELIYLDLSWCRQISDEALGLILDSCPLKLVKLFGCKQITGSYMNGHSNSTVEIVGLNLAPILDNINKLEPEGVFLRHSPLMKSSAL